jgi:hypothetical protein
VVLTEDTCINLSIMEQNDRFFAGNLTYKMEDEAEGVETFFGAIASDNKTFYIAEFDKGYDIETIISDDEMEPVYLKDGETAEAAIEKFSRVRE